MIKIPPGMAGLALLASGLIAFVCYADDPPPPPPEPVPLVATLTFADGETVALQAPSEFPAVALAPGESVSIVVQFPASFAGADASAQALDGGQVTADDFVIAEDGTASVGFVAGPQAGSYRVLLSTPDANATLEFQVTQP
jgi:hypothetical protein